MQKNNEQAPKIVKIIQYFITNDEIYRDKKGSEKSEIRKRKIVRAEKFSVDERITIIDGIIAIMKK